MREEEREREEKEETLARDGRENLKSNLFSSLSSSFAHSPLPLNHYKKLERDSVTAAGFGFDRGTEVCAREGKTNSFLSVKFFEVPVEVEGRYDESSFFLKKRRMND